MLVLQRYIGESIVIDGDIEVTVLGEDKEARGGRRIRLGITAPGHISVHRKEIQAKIDSGIQPAAPVILER